MENIKINGLFVFNPRDQKELMDFGLKEKKILVAVNAEKILHANYATKRLINENIGYSDGIGAIWALHKKGFKEAFKIPGCELWLNIVKEYYPSKSFYLVGGKKEIIESTVLKLRAEFSGIKILNYRDGYINSEDEKKELIEDIVLLKPDIVFVAMGSPKQEFLMEEIHRIYPALYQGLGGSFDVFTGNVKRAPKWWINNNLEWAFRLIRQPSRIKRQFHLIKFYYLLKTNQL